MAITFVAGWTEPIEYVLKIGGDAVNLTGMTVELVVRDKNENIVSTTGTVTKSDVVLGMVSYAPSEADVAVLVPDTYNVRFKVTDTAAKVAFFPNAAPERWTVGR